MNATIDFLLLLVGLSVNAGFLASIVATAQADRWRPGDYLWLPMPLMGFAFFAWQIIIRL